MPKTLLVDADIVAYQFAALNELDYVWDEETTSHATDFDAAVFELGSFVENLLKNTEAEDAIFCFSSPPNWRYEVLPTYKSHRGKKPQLFYSLKDYIREHCPVKEKPSLEADDVIGILATLYPKRYIIASIDKDLKQIPGLHYNWRTGEITRVSAAEADRWFWIQALAGDPTDGYKGCPGIGVKTAARIIDEAGLENPWPIIVETYESKGLTEEDALTQARVARILRKTDYDFQNQRPRLWVPPK